MGRYQKGPKMAQTKGKKMMKNVCFFLRIRKTCGKYGFEN